MCVILRKVKPKTNQQYGQRMAGQRVTLTFKSYKGGNTKLPSNDILNLYKV